MDQINTQQRIASINVFSFRQRRSSLPFFLEDEPYRALLRQNSDGNGHPTRGRRKRHARLNFPGHGYASTHPAVASAPALL
jgi:hypothetical protein